MVQVRLYRPFPAAGAAGRAARDGRADRGARPHQGARIASANRCSSTWSPRSNEAHADGDAGRHAAGDRRPVRPVLQGVHARDGRRGLRRTGPATAAPPVHRRHQRRRRRHQPAVRPDAGHRAGGHRARGVLRPRLRRHRRRQQEHHQDPRRGRRTCTRRATSSTTRRSRARRPCRTCASGRSRSGPRTWCAQRGLRRLPPVQPARAGRRAGAGPPRRDAAAQRAARRRARCGTRCRARCSSRSSTSTSTSTRSTPAASPARPAWPGRINTCCRPASSRSPACCRATRRSRGSRPRSPRPTASGAAEVVARNQAAVDRALAGLHRVAVPDSGRPRPAGCRRWCRRRAGVRPHGDRRR